MTNFTKYNDSLPDFTMYKLVSIFKVSGEKKRETLRKVIADYREGKVMLAWDSGNPMMKKVSSKT